MSPTELWKRYQRHLCDVPAVGMQLDVSRMNFDGSFLDRLAGPMAKALAAMERIEKGARANTDEDRMVGHYWLRAPDLAPTPEIRSDIESTVARIKKFAADVHSGKIRPRRGDGFYLALIIGIGGSALGPQFIADALGTPDDPMLLHFLDNTDPDGIGRVLAELGDTLAETVTVVVSKSGGTIETRNGMLETAAAYRRLGLSFPAHAVAITGAGSELHQKALGEGWLATFPMWDWVGGRTSVTSAVGLLPAALTGIDIDALLSGARLGDAATREADAMKNPAALLALMWHYAGDGHGRRNMVVMPYRDRLALFGKYLQQLVMESIGKERDRSGATVHQGLTVYGNKGTTDQHAYVQQLREGSNDFFVTFIDVRRDRDDPSLPVEEDVTSGDYLQAFRLGTRDALYEKGRESLTITFDELNARSVGALIALFERAVGLYAELINVNAYHQPGVEAGKRAASVAIALQRAVLTHLRGRSHEPQSADEIAAAIGRPDSVETIYHILEHAAANPDHGIRRTPGRTAFDARYQTE